MDFFYCKNYRNGIINRINFLFCKKIIAKEEKILYNKLEISPMGIESTVVILQLCFFRK